MIVLLLLCTFFTSYSIEKEVSYINVSSAISYKAFLEPDRKYDICCSSGSTVTIEFLRPGNYFIKRIVCSSSSTIYFLKPVFEKIHLYVEDLLVNSSSCVHTQAISQYISFNKETIKSGSKIVK